MRKTKIICTLGPAVDDEATLRALMAGGMDCARFNFSHGTHAEQKARMDRVKRLREELNLPIAIMLDTKGPEIRLRDFQGGSAAVRAGQTFVLDGDGGTPGDETRAGLSYPALTDCLQPGARILIDDGKVAMEVTGTAPGALICTVRNDGRLSNHKSLNIPGMEIPMPYISPADRADILFGIQQDVDFIAASFVRSAQDLRELRQLLRENGGEGIQIISKIESTQGLANLDEIFQETDGVMVARGDLGVELPFETIPAIQKRIIEQGLRMGKPVITATQMLESMTHSPRPTRAEVSDIANAVYDGTNAIMLSGESAAGDYPVEAVQTMAKIAESAESAVDYRSHLFRDRTRLERTAVTAICIAACDGAEYLGTKAIVAITRTGRTAAMLSDFRPACPILAPTRSPRAMRQLNLRWGVRPFPATEMRTPESRLELARATARAAGFGSGDVITVVSGTGSATESDTVRFCRL